MLDPLGATRSCWLAFMVACVSSPAPGVVPARSVSAADVLAKREPGVRWTAKGLIVDVTWDAVPDAVVLGVADGAVVGVVEGPVAADSRSWASTFPAAPLSQGGICGEPELAEIHAEALGPPLDELGCGAGDEAEPCRSLRGLEMRLRAASGRGSKGVRLDTGGCDAFHLYFDGAGFRWWRR